jgi:transposase
VEASTASVESTDEKDDFVIALAREGLTQREIQRRLNEKIDSGMNNNRLAELHKKGRALAAAPTGEASTASEVPQAAVGDVSLKKLAAA